MNSLQPRYPALIVHYDGSLGVLAAHEYWSGDVDQWFWSDAGDYLIDSEAARFDQHCVRDVGGRPLAVPEWSYTSPLSADEVYSLAASAPDPQIRLADLACVGSAVGRIAFLIERVSALPWLSDSHPQHQVQQLWLALGEAPKLTVVERVRGRAAGDGYFMGDGRTVR
jgi:hypothetical protein